MLFPIEPDAIEDHCHDEVMSRTKSKREIAIRAACFALRFLVHPDQRVNARRSMSGFSDAAIFYRWMSLSWTFGEPEVVAILTLEEKQEVDEFYSEFLVLPWHPIESHPFISDVSEFELSKLVPAATILLESLENRLALSDISRPTRFIFLCTAPFFVATILLLPFLARPPDMYGWVVLGALELLATCAMLGLYDAVRFHWCWRAVGAIVFAGYFAYLINMVVVGQWVGNGRRSSSTVLNAFIGLLAFGYPGFMYAALGRFTWRSEKNNH